MPGWFPGVLAVSELGPASRALLAAAAGIHDDRGLADQVCKICVAELGIDAASISLQIASPSWQTVAATDATAELLEELQFSLNEGICLEAAERRSPVLVPDLREGASLARWPMYAAAVAERTAVEAMFALPLQWGTINLGVLVLYRFSVGSLSEAQWRDALNVADMAVLIMLRFGADADGTGAGWLNLSAGARAEIHQATGMVLAQLGVGPQEALARMRAYAFAAERLLADVARDVVARRLHFTPDMT